MVTVEEEKDKVIAPTGTAKVTMKIGMWKSAPFLGYVEGCINGLNRMFSDKKLNVDYDLLLLKRNKNEAFTKRKIDILFFDGGEDINPHRYREENRYSHFSDKRDKEEFDILEMYYKEIAHGMVKVSGVCRGQQLMNVYLGGSLYQDISQELYPHHGPHGALIAPSREYKFGGLTDFVGNEKFQVSSMHHQSVKKIASGMYVNLISDDTNQLLNANIYSDLDEEELPRIAPIVNYIVEGLIGYNGNIRTLQSHPEFNMHEKDSSLFAYLMFVDHSLNLLRAQEQDIKTKLAWDLKANPYTNATSNYNYMTSTIGTKA